MSNTNRAKIASSAAIRRCLKVARDEGLEVSGFEALADGTVRILTGDKYPDDPFKAWENKK